MERFFAKKVVLSVVAGRYDDSDEEKDVPKDVPAEVVPVPHAPVPAASLPRNIAPEPVPSPPASDPRVHANDRKRTTLPGRKSPKPPGVAKAKADAGTTKLVSHYLDNQKSFPTLFCNGLIESPKGVVWYDVCNETLTKESTRLKQHVAGKGHKKNMKAKDEKVSRQANLRQYVAQHDLEANPSGQPYILDTSFPTLALEMALCKDFDTLCFEASMTLEGDGLLCHRAYDILTSSAGAERVFGLRARADELRRG
jgi:hypothetical protein